ncbi:MAG: elongation factor P [Chloroflexi bacterium]|nr:elongation factor P [Chloroflexota bacterium]
MVISVTDLRKGLTVEMDGEPYQVVEYSSQKMQQRAPVTRIRFKEMRTGKTVDKSFGGTGVQFRLAQVENRPAQYLYNDGDLYYFMDTSSYEQYSLNKEQMGSAPNFIKEQMEVMVVFYKEAPMTLELPTFAELTVVDTPPSARGNTAQGGTKPARLDTGHVVNVPFFINNGDTLRVDTRTGQYLERVT